ncbi:hypothetical protein GC176_26410 [bacterium]|nr:hypothetical protein [bacterium]
MKRGATIPLSGSKDDTAAELTSDFVSRERYEHTGPEKDLRVRPQNQVGSEGRLVESVGIDLKHQARGSNSGDVCFKANVEQQGLDHWEVRGWRCVHRHFCVTALSHLFCARIRAEFNASPDTSVRVTLEGVRSAMNV